MYYYPISTCLITILYTVLVLVYLGWPDLRALGGVSTYNISSLVLTLMADLMMATYCLINRHICCAYETQITRNNQTITY